MSLTTIQFLLNTYRRIEWDSVQWVFLIVTNEGFKIGKIPVVYLQRSASLADIVVNDHTIITWKQNQARIEVHSVML